MCAYKKIKIGICGIGNCASSLIQGIEYYKKKDIDQAIGLMHWKIGEFTPKDIEVTCAFDIDKRKVGKDISEAIFAKPNCCKIICHEIPFKNVRVQMGKILDSIAPHMNQYPENNTFVVSDDKEPSKEEIIEEIQRSECEILVNYLPVGSEKAVKFYAECALEANAGFINCMPIFIASNPKWATKFADQNLPVIGDDIKSQLGATIVHRVLTNLFKNRGVKLDKTYQLNTGGNTDFLNMLDKNRLTCKKISKTEAVQSQTSKRLNDEDIHIGPSDWVSWQKDNKVCFIRMEARIFGDLPIELELRLSVQDSPNSAGVVIDAIRCMKLALKRNQSGVLYAPSAFFMKHPPMQLTDDHAYQLTEDFINGEFQKQDPIKIKEYIEKHL